MNDTKLHMVITVRCEAFILAQKTLSIDVKCFPDILSKRLSMINAAIDQHL